MKREAHRGLRRGRGRFRLSLARVARNCGGAGGRPTLMHAVGTGGKNRGGFVFGGNFGSSADIILRFIALWLIRHSTGRGAEEYA